MLGVVCNLAIAGFVAWCGWKVKDDVLYLVDEFLRICEEQGIIKGDKEDKN